MDISRARNHIDDVWNESILPTLDASGRLSNESPSFEPNWANLGYIEPAVIFTCEWARAHLPKNAHFEICRLEDRAPLIFIDCPGVCPGNTFFYGHLDKGPDMAVRASGSRDLKMVEGEKKFGGSWPAHNGVALFTILTAINVLQMQGIAHGRCVILFECAAKSGSDDLPLYLDHLSAKLGSPDLVVCLDAGAGDNEHFWLTTSLRGLVEGILDVRVLKDGMDGGDAGGVVPASFRISRYLLDRIEDSATGEIKLKALNADIPTQRIAQAKIVAAVLGTSIKEPFHWVDGMRASCDDLAELLVNQAWRPALMISGADGFPATTDNLNVLRPGTQLKFSIRTPPTVDASLAYCALKKRLEEEPPYGSQVNFNGHSFAGWHAQMFRPWLHRALDEASQNWFSQSAMYIGGGRTMPAISMLTGKFPMAQLVLTGVLSPHSSVHSSNDWLHLPAVHKLTGCIAQLLRDHGLRQQARANA